MHQRQRTLRDLAQACVADPASAAAWADLVQALRPCLCQLVTQCRVDRHQAEEAVQAALAVFLGRLRQGRPPRAPDHWLFTVARNHLRKEAERRDRYRPLGDDRDIEDPSTDEPPRYTSDE